MSTTPTLSPIPPDGHGERSGAAQRLSERFAVISAAGGRRRHAIVLVPFLVSLVLNTRHLAQNGYSNIFYSGAIRSMQHSLHNFFFVSFDPGGLVSVDKPPLALWVQAASAKVFGFHPLSLLLPEALAGAFTVLVIYAILARRLGVLAGFAGAMALAVYPTFVAVSRDNGVDPLLILLMALACAAGVRACETGRMKSLLASAVLVGLAFNTKTLAAALVVPPIAAGYLICAPEALRQRIVRLLVAGVVMVLVSFSWIAIVEATPASKRPYVGSSTDNTELGLTFQYNGVGRVEGQNGGPHGVKVLPGAFVPSAQLKHNAPGTAPPPPTAEALQRAMQAIPAEDRPATVSHGPVKRARLPIPFGPSPGLLRLFGIGLGAQVGWLLPLALCGLLGIALLVMTDREAEPDSGGVPPPPLRRDPRLATLIVLGGWFLTEAIVLSLSKGIVHPYYVSALAPSAAAMAGAGLVAIGRAAQGPRRWWALGLLAAGVGGTVLVEVTLMHREHYHVSFVPILLLGSALAVGVVVVARRFTWAALAGVFALLLVIPAGYAKTTWLAPVEGTFPVAGGRELAGHGGVGLNERDLAIVLALKRYVQSHRPGSRYELLTVASDTASPYILLGMKASALGGYSGTDPALDGRDLARLIERGEARYVLLGGEYSMRGGNRATAAVLRSCRQLTTSRWNSPVNYPFGLVLFDCAGRAGALAGSS